MEAAAGSVGARWHCDVGVVAGEAMGEERDTTYACLISLVSLLASLERAAASLLCTATEKRRQKLGSCTIAIVC